MGTKKLFRIGTVAKLFHISVSSLRHYEEEGLLTPEYVDPATGYRYYSYRQFEALNTIRYLRTLDLPLPEIADFLQNRDVERIEEMLRQQKEAVISRQRELKRVERKIDNRLRQLQDARQSVFDEVRTVRAKACRAVWVMDSLKIDEFWDMEAPIRRLDQEEALIFLGKVGVGISAENLLAGRFEQYDGIFLVLEDEDEWSGESAWLPETDCVSVRFRSGHGEAPEQYGKLMGYIRERGLKVSGFSREITMIDYGLTDDAEKFVTEIRIPVEGGEEVCAGTALT